MAEQPLGLLGRGAPRGAEGADIMEREPDPTPPAVSVDRLLPQGAETLARVPATYSPSDDVLAAVRQLPALPKDPLELRRDLDSQALSSLALLQVNVAIS